MANRLQGSELEYAVRVVVSSIQTRSIQLVIRQWEKCRYGDPFTHSNWNWWSKEQMREILHGVAQNNNAIDVDNYLRHSDTILAYYNWHLDYSIIVSSALLGRIEKIEVYYFCCDHQTTQDRDKRKKISNDTFVKHIPCAFFFSEIQIVISINRLIATTSPHFLGSLQI